VSRNNGLGIVLNVLPSEVYLEQRHSVYFLGILDRERLTRNCIEYTTLSLLRLAPETVGNSRYRRRSSPVWDALALDAASRGP